MGAPWASLATEATAHAEDDEEWQWEDTKVVYTPPHLAKVDTRPPHLRRRDPVAKKATASEQAAQERAAANAAAEATIPTMASQRFNTAFKAAADKLPDKIKGDKQWYVLSETTLQPLREARDRAEGHRRANPRSALAARRAKMARGPHLTRNLLRLDSGTATAVPTSTG